VHLKKFDISPVLFRRLEGHAQAYTFSNNCFGVTSNKTAFAVGNSIKDLTYQAAWIFLPSA
jgi:hypothetical protein